VQRRYAAQGGERIADFLTIVCWRQLAENCAKYLSKGRKVLVEGSIQTRSYDAQDGSKRYVTEIIADSVEALGGRQEGEGRPADAPNAPPEQQRMDMPPGGGFVDVDDPDDLPF
jgi:single-strand DNA-binding protein